MSNEYKNPSEIPTHVLVTKLLELTKEIQSGNNPPIGTGIVLSECAIRLASTPNER